MTKPVLTGIRDRIDEIVKEHQRLVDDPETYPNAGNSRHALMLKIEELKAMRDLLDSALAH